MQNDVDGQMSVSGAVGLEQQHTIGMVCDRPGVWRG